MKTGFKKVGAIALLATALQVPTVVSAGDLIYFPTNPSFGGNPNNFDNLIGLAQIQNPFTESGGGGGGGVPNISFPPITIDLGGIGGGSGDLVDDTGDTGDDDPV